MATWNEFAETEPALAQAGPDQLFQYGVGLAFLATVRKDGGPRLHPVCPVLSKSRLYILVLPNSPKRWDLERDGRYAIQAFPQDKPDSDEFYLSGTARLVNDPVLFASVLSDAKHHASPDEILFELEIDRAMHTRWEGFGTPDYRPLHTTWITA
ncbi:MAG TPA: pyridoxamine 5'-phosphate oxidase [Anaerolineae bacterium]|nr:pyridoxamine 5'-phosphate oxidase [Anaerolineae bacterium]